MHTVGFSLNQKGMFLIQAIIGMGLLAIMSLIFALMMGQQQKQILSLAQKGERQEVANLLNMVLTDSNSCDCLLNGASAIPRVGGENYTFNSLDAEENIINIKQILSGCNMSATPVVKENLNLSTQMSVDKVRLRNLKPVPGGGANEYEGDWEISFKNAVIGLQPIKISQRFDVNAGNANAVVVIDCKGISTPSGAPPVQIDIGDDSDGTKDLVGFWGEGIVYKAIRSIDGKVKCLTDSCTKNTILAENIVGMLGVTKGSPATIQAVNNKGEIVKICVTPSGCATGFGYKDQVVLQNNVVKVSKLPGSGGKGKVVELSNGVSYIASGPDGYSYTYVPGAENVLSE